MIYKYLNQFIDRLPATAQLKVFGITKVPLIFLTNPKVLFLDENRAEVFIPLNYITRNHVGSMYFGTLAIGADCAAAVLAIEIAKKYSDYEITPLFKDMHADFIKRAESDVVFLCSEGEHILSIIKKAITSGLRVTAPITVEAVLNSNRSVIIAKFTLGLSVRPKLKQSSIK